MLIFISSVQQVAVLLYYVVETINCTSAKGAEGQLLLHHA